LFDKGSSRWRVDVHERCGTLMYGEEPLALLGGSCFEGREIEVAAGNVVDRL